MTPAEIWVLFDANKPEQINGVDLDDYERMLERRAELEQQGIEVI